jgi:hypothetical protein
LSLCWSARHLELTREAAAHSLISQLSQAVQACELSFAAYPPGDGQGSQGLVLALKALKEPCTYFDFGREVINDLMDRDGNIQSPIDPAKPIRYQCPGLHNPKSFDLWCEDSKGRAEGINNWEK